MQEGPSNPNHHKLKIVFIGDSGVGKSSLVNCYTRQEFKFQTCSTVGVQFSTREAQAYVNGVLCDLTIQLWDTAGQQRFRSLMGSYFKNALGLVFVYDITRHESFQNLTKWYDTAMENCNEFVSLLVIGNKTDLDNLRKVSRNEASEWAHERKTQLFEVSSLLHQGIEDAMEYLVLCKCASHSEIVAKLNTVDKDNNNAGISRYSQASRMSFIMKDQPYKERSLRSCC